MAEKTSRRRRAGAGRAARPKPARQKPARRRPEGTGRTARPQPAREKPARPQPEGTRRAGRPTPAREKPARPQPEGTRRAGRPTPARAKPAPPQPGRTGRAGRHQPSRFDPDDRDDKVAPWEEWTSVALHPEPVEPFGKYPVQYTVSGLDKRRNARYTKLISSAAHKLFKIEEPPREGEGPAAYLVETLPADDRKPAVQLLRVVYKDLIVQFKPDVKLDERNAILERAGFRKVRPNLRAKNQWIVRHVDEIAGERLLAAADAFERVEEVDFAWPHSVAEYRRSSVPAARRWLHKLGVNDAEGERSLDFEGRSSVVIAVLDDGVDIDHPNLKSRVVPNAGRDFNFADDEDDFSDPRPKNQADEDDEDEDEVGESGDYHGTLCAGVICSDGNEMAFKGVAPACKLVAVRIFNGAELINEADTVASAITYAATVADVISCSWGGIRHKAVAEAIDATSDANGNGAVLVGAAGNDGKVGTLDFPARHPLAIAVGACGPKDQVTGYANRGSKVDVVAPSGLDMGGVFSTDVSQPGWGLKTGAGGAFSDDFGSTSAAAAMAAGVAALCLSANPNLTVPDVRRILRTTADKVGKDEFDNEIGYAPAGPTGRSDELGSGRINAANAVAEAKKLLGNP